MTVISMCLLLAAGKPAIALVNCEPKVLNEHKAVCQVALTPQEPYRALCLDPKTNEVVWKGYALRVLEA